MIRSGLVVRIAGRITTHKPPRPWSLVYLQDVAGNQTTVPVFPGREALLAGIEEGDWIKVTGTLLPPTDQEPTPALVPAEITRLGQSGAS